jgi:hypothetical protein
MSLGSGLAAGWNGPWRRLRLALVVLAFGSCSVATSALASPRVVSAGSHPLVLSARFTGVSGAAVSADGRYVFVGGPPFAVGKGQLIDSRTGRHAAVSAPGCLTDVVTPPGFAGGPPVVGAPWLAFVCNTGLNWRIELYQFSTHAWSVLALAANVLPLGCSDPSQCVSVAAVGSNWIALRTVGCDEHCPAVFVMQDLLSGSARQDPSNSTTTVNLNSAVLTRHVCAPVRVPFVSNVNTGPPSGWGSVTRDGAFAITAGPGGAYLQKCGSARRKLLTFTTSFTQCWEANCPPPSNSHAIVWQSARGRLSGVFLPSGRPFVIHIPTSVDPKQKQSKFISEDGYGLALTARSLYLAADGRVWKTASPTPPSRH